ncbi:tRNA lysidine(34) synthetase TilS [Halomonas sp. HP20-15]|uniref:tRNA lysidine(34) synthetase TilS n=1 Tax=Halomonas sp. HP20-15 TaxID=3085901 RepID=UPI0029815F5D|nr:tRNA lysidine(34) synthetase TilS [Halomonas sp. HP20-15]MDW5376334.1 tRNA lysidine(34) synthetase TilS [Halomonas sp. HP20-15]
MSLQATIDRALVETPPGRAVWVALSGGLDSSLLLTLAAHAAHRVPRPLYALHVNHALQPAADDFERHCRALCSRLGVPLYVERVAVERAGKGIEAAAREARYVAFARRVARGETLWLAQHGDDQAESVLLAALRGGGIRGLAAMPARRDWQGRQLVRPLLGVTRARLVDEAAALGVRWCDDPSNADTAFDRNFLRREVLPLLGGRWPAAAASLAGVAERACEADALLDELAALDLARAGGMPARLALDALRQLSPARQRLLIRHACQRLGLPTPPSARLESLLGQLKARADARVHIAWPGGEARCWRGRCYLQAPLASVPSDWRREWDGHTPLTTPLGVVDGYLAPLEGGPQPLVLTLRQGGESLRVAGRGRRDVKRLLQEAGVPPWLRPRQLLAWHGPTLVAVLDVAVAEGWERR